MKRFYFHIFFLVVIFHSDGNARSVHRVEWDADEDGERTTSVNSTNTREMEPEQQERVSTERLKMH